jgi:hypothetical protein
MDFIDKLRELAAQIPKLVENIRTEEATKSALVMPFIGALGYNVFDPTEVTPEFVADVGVKKGEKVDYVILKDKKPIVMFECKSVNTDLDKVTPTQLYRYFSVSPNRFGILTNGIVYRFYSDLQEPNKMDITPFLELNMLGLEDVVVEEVKKFTKPLFDADAIVAAASDFKYTREIKRVLQQQLQEPTEDFVKFFANQLYQGRTTQAIKEQFTVCVKRAFSQFVNDQINTRLKSALVPEIEAEKAEAVPANAANDVSSELLTEDGKPDKQIVTTAEELEAFYIVKAITREIIDAKRIIMRDALSYCAILFDDNNRKPICRLWFNGTNKYIGFFDSDKREEKVLIDSVDDLYRHADRLKAAVNVYLNPVNQE